jgi:small basic protein (TIGR04137 family)
MSLDRSLKSAGTMGGHRNVLTRAERIAKLKGDNRFTAGQDDPMYLPKVGNRKTGGGKKVKKEAEGAEGAAAPAAGAKPAAGAAAAKPAAGAAAKPAAGAKK